MQWMKYLRTTLVLGALTLALFAFQGCSETKVDLYATGVLEGSVMDFTSEELLGGVILTTNPPTVSVVSDSAGYFIFSSINEGDYNLIASKNGYISESVSISVNQNRTSSVAIILERSSEYNEAPVIEGEFYPADGEVVQGVDVELSWTVTDQNPEDILRFDVEVYESNFQESSYFTELEDQFVQMEGLRFNTVYYWQVNAHDGFDTVQSKILSFRTADLPDNDFRYVKTMEDGTYEIFSSDSLETTRIQLTRNSSDDWQPRLSPTDDLIAFVAHYNLQPYVYTMNRDGSDIQRISPEPVTGYHNSGRGFTWTRNGSDIIYSHYNKMMFKSTTGNYQGQFAEAPTDRHFRDLDYSPAGTVVVAQTVGTVLDSSEIYLYDLYGGDPVLLVPNLKGIIESPSFSVDGSKVMFTWDVSTNILPDGRQIDARIFTIDVESGILTDLSIHKAAGTNDLNPRYSPNGAYIIFENGSNEPGSRRSIYIMDNNGGNRKLLFEDAIMPDWG